MTDEETPEDLIRYDVLTQEALRGVIQKVLEEVATTGLPGEHHFFITFKTDHPGVRLSTRMRERYPDEMTIVIQHSFWDLNVTDAFFEIDLSFDDILERLRIPYASLQGFFDPHVKFGVQFDADYIEAANSDLETDDGDSASDAAVGLPIIAQVRDITTVDDADSQTSSSEEKDSEEDAGDKETSDEKQEGAEVVSLDSFRKNR